MIGVFTRMKIVLEKIISNYVLRFKFKFIILQTVSYASLLYMDFVLCVVALSISIADSGLVFGNPTGQKKKTSSSLQQMN